MIPVQRNTDGRGGIQLVPRSSETKTLLPAPRPPQPEPPTAPLETEKLLPPPPPPVISSKRPIESAYLSYCILFIVLIILAGIAVLVLWRMKLAFFASSSSSSSFSTGDVMTPPPLIYSSSIPSLSSSLSSSPPPPPSSSAHAISSSSIPLINIPVKIVAVAGQSNAVGYAYFNSSNTINVSSLNVYQYAIQNSQSDEQGVISATSLCCVFDAGDILPFLHEPLIDAHNPANDYGPLCELSNGDSIYGANLGGMHTSLMNEWSAAEPNTNFVYVDVAKGSSGFSTNQWGVGQVLETNMFTNINAALTKAAINFQPPTYASPILAAIFWNQGETDASNDESQSLYTSQMLTLISRSQNGANINTATSSTPFIVIQPNVGLNTPISNALVSIPSLLNYTSYVPPPPVVGIRYCSGIHYSIEEQRDIGYRAYHQGLPDAIANNAAQIIVPSPPSSTATPSSSAAPFPLSSSASSSSSCTTWTVSGCLTPNSIPNPHQWLTSDLYYPSTTIPWPDQSGNNHNAMAGPNSAPIYGQDPLNGITSVLMNTIPNANSYFIMTGAFPYSQNMAFTFIVIVRGTPSDGGAYTLLASTTIGTQDIAILNPGTGLLFFQVNQAGTASKNFTRGVPVIISAIYTYSTSTILYYIGGYAAGSTGINGFTGPDVTLGAVTSQYYYIGDIYEFVTWNATSGLNITSLQKFESLAAARYGLTYPQPAYCC